MKEKLCFFLNETFHDKKLNVSKSYTYLPLYKTHLYDESNHVEYSAEIVHHLIEG
jgi:hypothetical protein